MAGIFHMNWAEKEEHEKDGVNAIKHVCPFCGGRKFGVTAQVAQDWAVDENGNWLKTVNECLEVTHFPDQDDEWDCLQCRRPYPKGNPFYFTFGSDPAFPYQNTYLVVFAGDRSDAIAKFRKKYPDRPGHEGTYNTAFTYSQEEWDGSICEKTYGLPAEVIE